MTRKINRRTFITESAKLGLSALVGGSVLPHICSGASTAVSGAGSADIAIVTGANYFNNTINAVTLLGGMEKFVAKGVKVGLLVNSSFDKPGTYVMPEVALAAIKMCYDAGAKEITLLNNTPEEYWGRSGLSKKYSSEIKKLKSADVNFTKIKIPQGKKLKEAEVVKELMKCDVFINIAKTKDHSGTKFTGTMKNMMGATSRTTNGFFHFGSNPDSKDPYNDVEFLSQCIADLNLIRRPHLCIADATEFITTNGPFGPGKITKPQHVIAGVDGIAVDSHCATLLGLSGNEVIMIRKGHEQGLGEIDLKKLKIQKAKMQAAQSG